MPVQLTADLLEAFAGTFLSPGYDEPVRTPAFHRECWSLYCSPAPLAAIAAPRGHAKSTALTHSYILATLLFRVQNYIILVGSTEDMAIEHLGDIARELRENDDLMEEFGIAGLLTDAKTDIIAKCHDGYEFRVIAKGAGQKMRGRKWHGRRPGLVVADDLEDDEQVEGKDQREKFKRWFLRAMKPVVRKGGKIRMHGTILHEDSLLANIMKNPSWSTKLFRAHDTFDEFTNILWPEQYSEERLRLIRQEFIDGMDPAGYAQEYLNNPFDHTAAYLRREDFRAMVPEDHTSGKIYCAAADFAITKADRANRTAIVVGGKDSLNLLHHVDCRVGRWDADEIIDELFSVQERWNPDVVWVEKGQIWNAISPALYKEMQKRGRFINFFPRASISDKASRGRSFQRRMRAGACRFDAEASWYAGYQDELLRFTGTSDALLDDQFDATALLSLGFDDIAEVEEDDFLTEDELDFLKADPRRTAGRNAVTGY